MKTKTEQDGEHPSSNYLVVTDPDEPSTWHLRVRNTFGQPDHKLMGDAWAALHEGFRGQKYEGPGKMDAIKKLTELYHSENMRLPGLKNREGDGRLIICNRTEQDADGWIHIVPKGELPNAEAGIVQVLDDKALRSIYSGLHSEHTPADAPGLYAGREHFIYDPNQDSAALAWFKDFQLRENGIWANRDGLTPDGRDALAKKKYKFTSFVADSGDLEHLGSNRYRVKKIETVGFTNMANGKHLLTPIMNRQGEGETTAEGQPVPRSNDALAGEMANQMQPLDSGKRAEIEAWLDAVAEIGEAYKQKLGRAMANHAAWAHARAAYPDLYRAAFGQETDDRPARSEAEARNAVANCDYVRNRIETLWGVEYRWAWNFVREQLPQVFNRRFSAEQHAQVARPVNADNYAGIQKRAQKHFLDLVADEQTRYGIKGAEAFMRVSNRDPELKALASYEVDPRDAFRGNPALEDKLLNRQVKPMDDAEIQQKARVLFDKLVNEARRGIRNAGEASATFAAFRTVQNREPVLCDLVNKKITPQEAFERDGELRSRLKKIYG